MGVYRNARKILNLVNAVNCIKYKNYKMQRNDNLAKNTSGEEIKCSKVAFSYSIDKIQGEKQELKNKLLS